MEKKEDIKLFGVFATLVVTTVGVGIFSYPRQVVEIVDSDGWLVTLMVGILTTLLAYIVYKICELNEFKDFYSIINNCFGKVFGLLILMFICFYFLLLISVQMRNFVEVIKMYLLDKTPTEVILLATIIVGVYGVRAGTDNLVKFNQVAFFIMFIPMACMLLVLSPNADFTNILPILQNKPIDYIKALYQGTISFLGFEIIFLVSPLVEKKKKIFKSAFKGIIFITIFYALIVIFALGVLGKNQTKIILWPTITMVTAINIPNSFVERWEGIVMTLWILFYYTTFVNYFYFSSFIVKKSFKINSIKISSILIIPLIYFIAMYADNINELYRISAKVLNPVGLISTIVIPIIMLIISAMKSNKRRGAYEKS